MDVEVSRRRYIFKLLNDTNENDLEADLVEGSIRKI